MKKLIVIVMCAAALTACKKTAKTSYTPDCSGAAKSYATNVAPLMSSKCVSCHSSYNSYTAVNNDKSGIRSSIVAGTMPKSGTLSDAEKNVIVCWIDSGAPNN